MTTREEARIVEVFEALKESGRREAVEWRPEEGQTFDPQRVRKQLVAASVQLGVPIRFSVDEHVAYIWHMPWRCTDRRAWTRARISWLRYTGRAKTGLTAQEVAALQDALESPAAWIN